MFLLKHLVCLLLVESTLAITTQNVSTNCSSNYHQLDNHHHQPDDCHTLEDYSRNASFSLNNTKLVFEEGKHTLSRVWTIKGQSNLEFTGHSADRTVILCSNEAGLMFEHNFNITLRRLSFFQCGALLGWNTAVPSAALLFKEGNLLLIEDVTIAKAMGAGLAAHNVWGDISLLKVVVSSATEYQTSGNLINYTSCSLHNDPPNIKVQSSNFSNHRVQDVPASDFKSLSGLKIYLNKCHARISIDDCSFSGNVGSHFGGNLALVMDNVTNISALRISLTNSFIENGWAMRGGGLYVSISKFVDNVTTPSSSVSDCNGSVLIENVTFSKNSAKRLGAGLYMSVKDSVHQFCHYNVTVNACNFSDNFLQDAQKGGVAVGAINWILNGYSDQVLPQYRLRLKGCRFRNHSVDKSNVSTSGNSVLFVRSCKYFGIEDVVIDDNSVSAITAVFSNLIFQGNITLSHNRGSSGGGLLLCQGAVMYLKHNTSITIFGNEVEHAGGGICVEPQCLQTEPKCFFQLDLEVQQLDSITINLYNNTAGFGGHNLFGGDIDLCYMLDNPSLDQPLVNGSEFFKEVFHYANETSSVTSPPREVKFCEEKILSVFPGESFSMRMTLVGQLNGNVPGIVRAWSSDELFNVTSSVQRVKYTCTVLSYKIGLNASIASREFDLKLGVEREFNLKFGAERSGDESGYERIGSFKNKTLNVTLKKCPAGFTLTKSDEMYTCNSCKLDINNITCSVKSKGPKIVRHKYSNGWIGFKYPENDSMPNAVLYTKQCPLDYCVFLKREVIYLEKDKYSSSSICANNRDGLACGRCKRNYSALLGSSGCGYCEDNIHLVLLIAFTFAGLLLVMALTLLNLTISEGTLSGLIFYANVIQSNSSLLIPQRYKKNIFVLHVFISWINLDLGIQTCFYKGMNALAESWLQFVFPLYLWSIAALIIFLSRHYWLVTRIAGRNAVKVLATLILLSYTRIIYAVASACASMKICTLQDNQLTCRNYTWLIDPNLKYFEFDHKLLFGVSILFGLISLPFTLTLLFIQPLQRFSPHRRPFRWIHTFKPFFDAFTGPYSDSGRFWPGLLLIVRIVLSIVGGIGQYTDDWTLASITALSVVFLLSIAMLLRPGLYRVRALDFLECFFLLNLTLLHIGTASFREKDNIREPIFQCLVGMAMLAFILIIFLHLWLKVRRYQAVKKVMSWLLMRKLHILARLKRRSENVPTQQNLLHYPPYVQFIHDREPLLADDDE